MAEITLRDCVDCYAIPGADSLIDVIHPETGLTWYFGQTAEEVQTREPSAVRMSCADWTAAKAARQHTPIRWLRTTEQQYHKMLNILHPAAWIGGAFLVGEPYDHDAATGEPRFEAYWQRGTIASYYLVASRPITVRELRQEITRG